MIEIPQLSGKELFDWLIANKSTLIAQKKFEIKKGDAICYAGDVITDRGKTVKANTPISDDQNSIDVVSIINTTYWMDSHKDVHVDGIWKKSLGETRSLYLLQEHKMEFDKIISDEVKAYTKRISWKSLGVNAEGSTEALVFDSRVSKDRNTFMFGQYSKGYVKNHSVGMQYVKIDMAINDEDYPAHKALWDKYIDKIANRADAEESGYFWPVTEAKVIEGSAVPLGSNTITPTQSVKNIQPTTVTDKRAAKSTRVLQELNQLSKKLPQ